MIHTVSDLRKGLALIGPVATTTDFSTLLSLSLMTVKTWGGRSFDFHGACDLVFMNTPSYDGGAGLELHRKLAVLFVGSNLLTPANPLFL